MNATTTPTTPTMTAEQAAPGSRMPDPTELVPELKELGGWLYRATGNRSVPRATIGLVHLRAGQLVGSAYLTAMHSGLLRKAGERDERIDAVAAWRTATCFTGAELAALALVEAVLTPNPDGERVPDGLYEEAARHYDPTALATLTIAIGQVNFFVPLALIGKPVPGVAQSEQWT
ncbi:carboxymuconolactone decarboxylase family protein [Kitasatospora sp. NPDC094015]|uniref:carboxymuconolactone decarboxylase family protein n=1 Tax=Kitasatospora sp. NPDC094015 TaxID=3155205 RepID=UPI0033197C4E